MNNKLKFIEDLDAITLIELKDYLINNIVDLITEKNTNFKIIKEHRGENLICPDCQNKLHRNGKTKTCVQKYICSVCKKTHSLTKGTIVYNSKISFDIWKNVINNCIDGFSIRKIAKLNNISNQTSFALRHKVLKALDSYYDKVKLIGEVQADEKFFSINLKGTKKHKMPRFSKKRKLASSLSGISTHKVCVLSAIDENDNLIFNIGGLGRVTTEMVTETFKSKVDKSSKFTTDSASAYMGFCKKYNIRHTKIQSGFYAIGTDNLAEINACHSHLSTWLSSFRGVSIKHLQQYLNWFSFIFTMKKRFEVNILKIESYKSFLTNNNYIKSKDIFAKSIPIDLNIAYGEYNYQS